MLLLPRSRWRVLLAGLTLTLLLPTERASSALTGPVANTRVVVTRNLPGLAPGWEQIAHFRFEATVEKKHEFRKEGYFQWMEDSKELGSAV